MIRKRNDEIFKKPRLKISHAEHTSIKGAVLARSSVRKKESSFEGFPGPHSDYAAQLRQTVHSISVSFHSIYISAKIISSGFKA